MLTPKVQKVKARGRPPAIQKRVPMSARIAPITVLELNRLAIKYQTSIGRVIDSLVETVRANRLATPPSDPAIAIKRYQDEVNA
jgi:hypothetical protein